MLIVKLLLPVNSVNSSPQRHRPHKDDSHGNHTLSTCGRCQLNNPIQNINLCTFQFTNKDNILFTLLQKASCKLLSQWQCSKRITVARPDWQSLLLGKSRCRVALACVARPRTEPPCFLNTKIKMIIFKFTWKYKRSRVHKS